MRTGTGMGKSFIIRWRYFLKKRRLYQLPIRTKVIVIFYLYFLAIVLLTCDILVTSLFYLSGNVLMFFCFLLYMELYGCCCDLNPKSIRWVSHFLVWWGITKSSTRMSLSYVLGEWPQDWTRRFIEDDVVNGRFINTNSSTSQDSVD